MNLAFKGIIFFSTIFGTFYSDVFRVLVLFVAFVCFGRRLTFLTVTNTNSMKGKVVLITGGNVGIGEFKSFLEFVLVNTVYP